MRLLEKQQQFARCVALLIIRANELGYSVTLGDAYRDQRVHGDWGEKQGYGHPKSVHKLRLAVDLNLFDHDGNYVADTLGHEPLGTFWEALGGRHGLDLRWGGRFRKPDGNHYSMAHNGRA
jgi:hypothetical protein